MSTLINLLMFFLQQTTEPRFPEFLIIVINKNGASLIHRDTKVWSFFSAFFLRTNFHQIKNALSAIFYRNIAKCPGAATWFFILHLTYSVFVLRKFLKRIRFQRSPIGAVVIHISIWRSEALWKEVNSFAKHLW